MELPPTIPHAAAAAARRFGEAVAVVLPGRRVSFAGLWREARAATSAFIAAGIGKGDRVAIWAPNSLEWIVAALGAQTAGAAIVPLNTRLKGREAADQLRRSRCRLLFTVRDFLGTDYAALLVGEDLPELEATIAFDRDWGEWLTRGRGPSDQAVDAALARLSGTDLSDIIFTSGTTGAPKGAMHTHDRVIPVFANWADVTDLREGDRYLIANPFFHTFGYKAGWVAALLTGAAIVPMASFDVAEAIRLIEAERISFIPGAPTIYQSLLAERTTTAFDSSSLRVAVTGAATVPPVLVQRMHDELGFDVVVTGYGMTECGNITMCRAGDPIALVAASCGRAVPELEVAIMGDTGVLLAPGETGEIVARGRGVMLGYLDDPTATAEAIDPAGWLHTGDIGVLDDVGYLRITDRIKDMFICGGFNAYPAEIEKQLAAHPAVAEVAVIGVPDERLGEVGKAFVVLRPGTSASEAELIAWSRANMANYKAPRGFALVEALPRNASGKVVKTELRTLGEN